MLGKLIKHEFLATYKNYCLLYISLVVLTVLNKLFWLIDSDNVILNIIRGFVTALYVITIVGVIVMTFIFIISRFYKNLLKDEGYLSFTLPVSVSDHILSKLIVSFVWEIFSIISIFISMLIMAINMGVYSEISYMWDSVLLAYKMYDGLGGLTIVTIIIMIISLFMGVLMLYASLSLGQLFTKHKLAGSVLSFIGFYFIVQVINSLLFTGVFVGSIGFEELSVNSNNLTMDMTIPVLRNLFIGLIILQIIVSSAYYIITYLMLKRKLNLE